MSKIYLARPHAFIVSHMKDFLARNGYQTEPLQTLEELSMASFAGAAGAVISTAVSSTVGGRVVDAFTRIRKEAPTLPIAFATLLPFDQAVASLRSQLDLTDDRRFVKPALNAEKAPGLGTEKTFIVLHLDAIRIGSDTSLADALVRRHFSSSEST